VLPCLVFAAPVWNASAVGLEDRWSEIAAMAEGRVGVAAEILETGERVALRGGEAFPMQSVFKFPIAMAVLAEIDAGRLELDQRVRVDPSDYLGELQHSPIRDRNPDGAELTVEELLFFMVQESDGTACDVLLGLIGGPKVAHAFLRGLGVEGVTIATTEREMGADELVQYRNSATPAGMVELLHALHAGRGLTPESRELLLQSMTATTTGRHRLKAGLPPGSMLAHKTGSSRTFDGLTRATNDVGIVTLPDGRHLAIAVLVSDSRAGDSARERVIADVARAAWAHWTSP
jgi:beta-lactamase class A